MKLQQLVLLLCSMIITGLSITVLSSCSDNDDHLRVHYNENPTWKKAEDVVATLRYDEESHCWLIRPDKRFSSPFHEGAEEYCEIVISNWDEKYKDFSDGCLIQGEYKYIKTEVYTKSDGICFSTLYFEFNIQSIEKYDLSAIERARSQEKVMCACDDSENIDTTKLLHRAADINERMITSALKVNTFIHVVRSTAKEGLNVYQVVDGAIKNLNSFYNEAQISFVCVGYEYIDSDALNLIDKSQSKIVFSRNSHNNAIDIYVLSDGSNFKADGEVEGINSKACIVVNTAYESLALSHEIGHCLGLYHTHHGTAEEGTPELVDGSNSDVAGDYVSDTPADPNRWWESSFGYDENGDPYDPDKTNIMSYSPHMETLATLTPGQLYRIHQQVNSGKVGACVTQSTFSIDGPQFIKTTAEFSTNLPEAGNIISWSIDYKEYSSKEQYTPRELTREGSTISITNPNANAASQRYDMVAVSQSGRGYKFRATHKAYNTKLDPKCGTLSYSIDTPSSFGNIDLLSSTTPTLKIQQSGIVQFRYTDVCGLSTDAFNVNLWATGFSQVSGYKNYYKCSSNASTGILNTPINIVCNGASKVIQINFNILPYFGTNYNISVENSDSLQLELQNI